jgi:hypothetical protein
MIDNFAIGLTHFMMLYVAWKLLGRSDLNVQDDAPPIANPREGDNGRPLS